MDEFSYPAEVVYARAEETKRAHEALLFARMTLEHAIELGYLGEGSTRGMALEAIEKIKAVPIRSKP